MPDPGDVIWALEDRSEEQGFQARWRGFVRAVVPLLPGLPAEAARWWEAVDAYAAGRSGRDVLMVAQKDADRYMFSLSSATPDAVYCAVRAAGYPLCLYNTGGGWFEGILYFLHDCCAAGVDESMWWPLFRAAFPESSGGPDA